MQTSDVKLSYFTMPVHPPGRNYLETLKEDREAVLLADALGFSEAFFGEHITDIAETVTSSLMFCASLVDATKQIKLGSGTVNMPNNHPAQVAAQVAMIDTMLEGRFLFGISPGGLRSDAEVFGNLDRDRNAMFVEAIDQVLDAEGVEPLAQARQIAEKRLSQLGNLPREKLRRRLVAYLGRRGFRGSDVVEMVGEVVNR